MNGHRTYPGHVNDDIVYEVRQKAYVGQPMGLRVWLDQLRSDGYEVTDLGYVGRDSAGHTGHIFEIKRLK